MVAKSTALRLAVAAMLIFLTSVFLRMLYILPLTRPRRACSEQRKRPAHLLIVLGSGGHTAEMFSMLRNLDTNKYSPRTYVISSGDEFSSSKATEFESRIRKNRRSILEPESSNHQLDEMTASEDFEIITIPRARNIHQPLYTTLFSSFHCLIACFMLLIRYSEHVIDSPIVTSPDLIITNGPATGVMIIIASLAVKFYGLQKQGAMRSIYVESWARVKTLSLSGKILYHFGLTDRFMVQWKGLAGGRAEYRGPLIE